MTTESVFYLAVKTPGKVVVDSHSRSRTTASLTFPLDAVIILSVLMGYWVGARLGQHVL